MKTRIALILVLSFLASAAFAELGPSATTKVVMLGTGTPNADPERSGPSVAIVVNDTPYLVDFGPGVVRRATAMTPKYGGTIEGLAANNLKIAFLTHLHSDHSAGLPDLILTPWTLERDEPLQLYGPQGIEEMASNILQAYDADIRYRIDGLEPANETRWTLSSPFLASFFFSYYSPVSVEAFRVRHGTWENAFGFRFTTPDRVIVISGDAAPDDALEEHAQGADVLIHEVYSDSGFARRDPFWQEYHRTNHTSASELGEIADRSEPKLLVLYHVLFWGSSEETVLEEVRQNYSGEVVLAQDLDVY